MIDINKLALEAYPEKFVTVGDSHELWDENEQYRECWIEGYNKAFSLYDVGNHVSVSSFSDEEREQIIDEIEFLNAQNLNGRETEEQLYKQGISDTFDDLIVRLNSR